MSPLLGGLLSLAALFAGGLLLGWKGVVLALTVIVFWLLLQFSRLMRVMKQAGAAPLGSLKGSALMLHSQLKPGMPLLELLKLSGSLGKKTAPDAYTWQDAGGDRLEIRLHKGRVQHWTLTRATEAPAPATDDLPADTPAA
ncbi:hypothetical protein RQP53_21640 [Paucibacter sp. APW11]|uniref:Glycerate kinase n=1 Tax=Roseateles aquae TaxID=3077235 RepID=A0ABU3PHK0_9BURK|nr:hypothetical protein [Paucibacter sp. APW11]MDT9001895.1 hypothetical protein [Paucibacter sp. APW11]